MTKLKNPVLSLGAHGSIGEAVTFTKRRGLDIAEKKPELPYFLTLPVQYQRWFYQDYAAYWSQQNEATKRSYQSLGVRLHLTGFQYWMRFHLLNLPDILAYWKLDTPINITLQDSSKNNNDLTRFGASPAVGPIDNALFFDGINDRLFCAYSPSLETRDITVELFINTPDFANYRAFISRGFTVWAFGIYGSLAGIPNTLVTFINGVQYRFANIFPPGNYNVNTHVAFSLSDAGNQLIHYVNGVNVHTYITPQSIPASTNNLEVGRRLGGAFWYGGLEDQIIIYNRVLHPYCIRRHSQRRWP